VNAIPYVVGSIAIICDTMIVRSWCVVDHII